ncbi:ABC transporter substrate-binding protein [Corynebacterium xerosis]|uniref:ABC transporter substrate-binding protein n=1 Tax=Corynebacterium xerosis TaxID=1725 RepID=UPI00366BDA80
MFERQNRRRRNALFGSVAAAILLSGCMANPGDAPTVGEEEPRRDDPVRVEESLKRIQVGVDAFGEGFNPHLIADASPVTDLVSQLTLPSAFEPDPEDPARWRMSPDLLESAEIVPVDAPVPDEDAGGGERGGNGGNGSDGTGGHDDGNDGNDGGIGGPDAAAPSIAAEAAEADPSDARPGDTRIRYRIRSGAQWSDGTPISGSDFRYLHASLLANAGVAEASGYERIRAITVSGGGRQVDVLIDGPMPEWPTLFRNLLPSHLLRPSATPFVDVLDSGIPASGGRYSAQSIDVGRGEVRLVRNDRFWGESPAKTDTVIIRSVDGAVTGAEQLRAAQLQALRLRPKQTTALTYGLVPGAVDVPAVLARELTLHANVASPLLDDVSVRRAVFSAVDVPAVAAIATGRTDDLEIPAAHPSIERAAGEAPQDLSEVTDEVTDEDPLLIGVMGDDDQALAAARAIADQLTVAGLPARVTGADDQALAGSLLPYGRVDMVVAWGRSVDSPQQAASRWSCPAPSRASTEPTEDEGTGGETTTSAEQGNQPENGAENGSENGSGNESANGTASESREDSAFATTSAAPAEVARGSNLSGLCDPGIDGMIGGLFEGATRASDGPGRDVVAPAGAVPEDLRSAVGEQAIELGLVVDRILTVVGTGASLANDDDPATWPSGPFIGPLMTLPEWRRVPSATTSEVADPGDDPGAEGGPENAAGNDAGNDADDPGAGTS